MSEHAIVVEQVTKRFSSSGGEADWTALDNVDLRIRSGEFVSILGPSGCGKSTLLNILSGLEQDFQGEVRIQGKRIGRGLRSDVRVGYLFQEPRLLPWRTIRGNIELALEAAGFARSEWQDRADPWLKRVGLKEFAGFYPSQISGGMQQRTAIARAFAVEPEVLLMDEPFSALDELTARRLRQELLAVWETDRRTVVFVTHNSIEAAYLSDRIFIMKHGPNGRICDEVSLGDLPRPRSYDNPEQFAAQKDVFSRLLLHGGDEKIVA